MTTILIVFGLLIVAYLFIYLGGRKYLERDGFAGSIPNKPIMAFHATDVPPEKPYPSSPIDSIDDYEQAAVFQQRGSKEASQHQKNQAMAQYPMDWSLKGADSEAFQTGLAEYQKSEDAVKAEEIQPAEDPLAPTDALLPGHFSQDEEEKKILQTYQPKCTKSLLEYCVDDVKALVDRVYGRKGLIPVLTRSHQGPNIWEVTEVKEKNPHIVWEDDPATRSMEQTRDVMEQRGEETISIPYPASDLAAGLDPFFNSTSSTRDGKHDYTKWTPGMERMFAPTYPIKSWF